MFTEPKQTRNDIINSDLSGKVRLARCSGAAIKKTRLKSKERWD